MLSNTDADAQIDATGLRCPEPLILVRNQLRHMATSEVLLVKATDPSTDKDFRDLCRFVGHVLLQTTTEDSLYCFWIRKGKVGVHKDPA